jgi:hypothetical protein
MGTEKQNDYLGGLTRMALSLLGEMVSPALGCSFWAI